MIEREPQMPEGWLITLDDRGRRRGFLAGIADLQAAKLWVMQMVPDARDVRADPLPYALEEYAVPSECWSRRVESVAASWMSPPLPKTRGKWAEGFGGLCRMSHHGHTRQGS